MNALTQHRVPQSKTLHSMRFVKITESVTLEIKWNFRSAYHNSFQDELHYKTHGRCSKMQTDVLLILSNFLLKLIKYENSQLYFVH